MKKAMLVLLGATLLLLSPNVISEETQTNNVPFFITQENGDLVLDTIDVAPIEGIAFCAVNADRSTLVCYKKNGFAKSEKTGKVLNILRPMLLDLTNPP